MPAFASDSWRTRRACALVGLAVLTGAVATGCSSPSDGDSRGRADPSSTARASEPEPDPSASPAQVPRAGESDRLLPGDRLRAGESLVAEDAAHRLTVEEDGDVVLTAGNVVLWTTATGGNPGATLEMARNGRAVVAGADGEVLWTAPERSPGGRLVVKPDGRVYLISVAGASVWHSRTSTFLAVADQYVNPSSPAALAAARARLEDRPEEAGLLDKAASQGSARWLSTSDPVTEVEASVREYATAAAAAQQTPVFVTYAIPDRDCGNHSAGGFLPAEYRAWSAAVARGLAGSRAVVIVEPDSLLQVQECGNADERLELLNESSALYADAGAEVYLDAGNSRVFAREIGVIARRLEAAGVGHTAGFATNVSNFQATDDERSYAERLSERLGGARYVIDTSRNGNGGLRDEDGGVWCNPPGRALGAPPGATDDGAHVANLWVKTVGLSDGSCNGGPPAGTLWPRYLLELAANARW